jgi:hypothetical protein
VIRAVGRDPGTGMSLAVLFAEPRYHKGSRSPEASMDKALIQGWTNSSVPLESGQNRDVRYRVYREGGICFLEMCNRAGDAHIHTLELPESMRLDRACFEALLRYVLLNVAAA